MTKFRVTLTCLVEREATLYVDARTADEACEIAMDDVKSAVWHDGDGEAHTLTAEAERSEIVDRRGS